MACSSSRMRDLGTPNGGAFPAESSFLGGGRAGGFLLGFTLDGSSSSSSRSSVMIPNSRFSGTERSLPIGTLFPLEEEDLAAPRAPEAPGAMFVLAVALNALLVVLVLPLDVAVLDLSLVSDMVLVLVFDPSMMTAATVNTRRAPTNVSAQRPT